MSKHLARIALSLFLVALVFYYRTPSTAPIPPADSLRNETVEKLTFKEQLSQMSQTSASSEEEATPPIAEPAIATPPAKSDEARAASMNETAREAFLNILAGADAGDRAILGVFIKQPEPGGCPWCEDLYRGLAEILVDPSSSDNRRFFAAEILSFSNNAEGTRVLLDILRTSNDREARTLALENLARTRGTPEIISLASEELAVVADPQTREALVAMLGFQHSRAAVEALYKDLKDHEEPEAYAEKGIGLVVFKGDPEAIPFLREKTAKGDNYSAITLTSLLESGEQGSEEALVALNQIGDFAKASRLATRAAELIQWRNPESWLYLKERLAVETDGNTKQLIALLIPGPSPR